MNYGEVDIDSAYLDTSNAVSSRIVMPRVVKRPAVDVRHLDKLAALEEYKRKAVLESLKRGPNREYWEEANRHLDRWRSHGDIIPTEVTESATSAMKWLDSHPKVLAGAMASVVVGVFFLLGIFILG